MGTRVPDAARGDPREEPSAIRAVRSAIKARVTCERGAKTGDQSAGGTLGSGTGTFTFISGTGNRPKGSGRRGEGTEADRAREVGGRTLTLSLYVTLLFVQPIADGHLQVSRIVFRLCRE